MLSRQRARRNWLRASTSLSWAPVAGLVAAIGGFGLLGSAPAHAGQLAANDFQVYIPSSAASIQAGPFALYSVSLSQIVPTQMNVGFQEVGKKTADWDLLPASQLQSTLLTDIEPVVIGPGGVLYLENGHHTFTSLSESTFGSSNPTVYVNIVANFSNLTTQQFWQAMEADNLVLPLNDGVPETINVSTGAPIPASFAGETNDPYRGLEFSILKNKSSKLFKGGAAANILTPVGAGTQTVGSAIPGLDKLTGDFSDFLWADAYRNANNGLGLPYLSPIDIALATKWNLTGSNTTTLPNIGTVSVAQLPGYILGQTLVQSTNFTSTISNATLATGTLDGNGNFTGITSFNLGTASNPILVGTPRFGFVMQMGADNGNSVVLNGTNTYTGGTTIIAGNLIVTSDAALGAGPAETTSQFNSSLNINSQGFATSALAAVQADNGIVFNSLSEGEGTLQINTAANPGNGTLTFTTSRPIAVGGEIASSGTSGINLNGYIVTLNGPIVSLGTNSIGLGNESGASDLQIQDTSSNANGVLVLPGSSNNSQFFGNWIITSGTLRVSSDASLGNTSGPSYEIGQIDLNGGTLQAGANFSSVRSLFLGSGSNYDTNGFTTSFAGNLQDTQRTLTVINSNASTAGSVTFGSFEIGGTATLNVNAGKTTGGGAGTSVTFTNGIIRDTGGTLILQPTTTGNLGTLAAGATNSEDVFDTSTGPNATNKVTNGIVAPWIVVYAGIPSSQTPNSPFSFATYGANGFTAATVGGAITNNILTSTNANTVIQSTSIASGTVTSSLAAYALSVQNGTGINLNGHSLTLGDGANPAGLILNGGASITNGTLAFGGSEGVIWSAGQSNNTNTISAQITGTGGLTFAGGLRAADLSVSKSAGLSVVTISTASTETGPIIIDSGAVTLTAVNAFSSSTSGILLADTKTDPAPATLNINANNIVSALSSVGNNSAVNIATGDTLTIGDSQNLNSTLSAVITGSGSGSLVKAGTGVLDISGSGGVSFGGSGTVSVNAGALRTGNGVFGASATTAITVASGAELQFAGNGGSVFSDPVGGGGIFHLLTGTVQLTGANTYSGGTVIEVGATLDVTTATLPSGSNVSNAGGTLLFDQTTTGTYSGVMSDGKQAGGASDPNSFACISVACSGPTLSGTLIKDDSSTGKGGNVTLSQVQAYTGFTYIEGGTLTLGATDTIKTSAGVVLGRVGGAVCGATACGPGATAILELGADNTVKGLMDNAGNTTQVTLNGHTLTLAPGSGTSWTYAGAIVDGTGSGNLVQNGPGTSVLTGTSTYTGTTLVSAGTLDVEGTIANTSGVTVASGATLVGGGTIDPPTTTIINGTFAPGTPGSPGTSMTVNGNLQFNTGSNYIVQLNPTTSTFADVTGTAALTGNVLAAFQPGSYTSKQSYTILESAGLNNTKFTSLATTNSNFAASLSYTPNNVLLTLNAALGSGSGATGNQQNVANSINNFFNGGGTLTPNFASIFALSGGNLNQALSQLSGETATAAQTASFSMMTSFLGVMTDPSVDGRSGASGGASGFAPEQEAEFPPDIALAYASVMHKKQQPQPAAFEQRWTAWGSGFGGYNKTEGDPAAGTNTVTARAYGFAGGLDYHFTPDTVAGFALAGSGSNWSTAQNLGTGRSDSFQFGLYGTSRSGPAYVSASVGISEHWITTNRIAPLGDQLTARFDAQSYGARLEAGYRYGMMPVGVTPYAAVQTQLFHTPNYSETDLTGGGFGLTFASQNATDTRSELGARFDNAQIVNNMPLILRARVAWAHDWASDPTLSAAFQTLPGGNFIVNGAGVPTDSALTSAGAELRLTQSWSVLANFDGEFAKTSQTYSGTGTIRYVW